MISPNVKIISWNVRDLNATERCLAVHETLAISSCQIICLQEMKLQNIDSFLALLLDAYKLDKFAFKPAVGTKGGILLLWKDSDVVMSNVRIGLYSISAEVTLRHCMTPFSISTVYGPSRRDDKETFLQHLRHLKPPDGTCWLILGDFNLIYKASDKNNSNLNQSLMSRFRRTIDYYQIKEIKLQNRKYTWSNERRHPTLVRLDRVFCTQSWDLTFDACALHALSSSHSDHCLLLLTNQSGPRRASPFKFENFWTHLPCFQEVVAQAWQAPTTHTKPFHRLGHKLFTMALALKKWSKSLLSVARQKLHMAQEVIQHLDEAQESRALSNAEFNLRTKHKKRILSWLIIEKARKKQCSRISNIREGDANTHFFHLRANGRRERILFNAFTTSRAGSLITRTNNASCRTTSVAA
jgi:exonuclease III